MVWHGFVPYVIGKHNLHAVDFRSCASVHPFNAVWQGYLNKQFQIFYWWKKHAKNGNVHLCSPFLFTHTKVDFFQAKEGRSHDLDKKRHIHPAMHLRWHQTIFANSKKKLQIYLKYKVHRALYTLSSDHRFIWNLIAKTISFQILFHDKYFMAYELCVCKLSSTYYGPFIMTKKAYKQAK